MQHLFVMDNAILRDEYTGALVTYGEFILDDCGVRFIPEASRYTQPIDIPYAEVETITLLRQNKDNLVIAAADGVRHIICVHRQQTAEGVASIIRLMRAKAHAHAGGPRPEPPDGGGGGKAPAGGNASTEASPTAAERLRGGLNALAEESEARRRKLRAG